MAILLSLNWEDKDVQQQDIKQFTVISYQLPVFTVITGHCSLVTVHWLLVTLLQTLLPTETAGSQGARWLLLTLLQTLLPTETAGSQGARWSLFTGYWSLVTVHWLLLTGYWSLSLHPD